MSNETPSRPGNVLLAVDGRDSCEEEACMALSGVDDPDEVDVIFVTFTKSADQRLEAWRDHADAPPANIGIVSVEMGGGDGTNEAERNGGPAVRRISDPSDLTGVGIAISEFLSAWADTDQQTVVCFDSVTALLQYVEANRVFQFLNEMTSKFEQAGAHAHFHLMPEAHEPQDLSVLTSLFGERRTAASVVGAGATAEAPETAAADDAETPDDAAQQATDADAETGFVFGDAEADTPTTEADDSEPTTEADDSKPTTEADDTDATAEADSAQPATEAGEADSPAEPDDAQPATETTADTSEPETDADGDDSVGGDDRIGGDDGTATAADEPAGAPQDRVESSVQKVEDTGDAPTFGGESSATARAANEGRGAASAAATTTSTTTASATTAGRDDDDDDDGENWYKNATYSRTTATVIGVVTMLVLISFLAAAMPLPVGDMPDDSGNAITTATPEPTVSTAASGTTATGTPTPEPTATPTDSPTATETPTSDSSTGGSDGTSGTSSTDSTPTATATATATPAPTDTPTPTPDGDLTDTVDDTVDDTTDTVDDTTDTVDDTTDTVDDTTDTVDDTTDTVDDTLSDEEDDDLL